MCCLHNPKTLPALCFLCGRCARGSSLIFTTGLLRVDWNAKSWIFRGFIFYPPGCVWISKAPSVLSTPANSAWSARCHQIHRWMWHSQDGQKIQVSPESRTSNRAPRQNHKHTHLLIFCFDEDLKKPYSPDQWLDTRFRDRRNCSSEGDATWARQSPWEPPFDWAGGCPQPFFQNPPRLVDPVENWWDPAQLDRAPAQTRHVREGLEPGGNARCPLCSVMDWRLLRENWGGSWRLYRHRLSANCTLVSLNVKLHLEGKSKLSDFQNH